MVGAVAVPTLGVAASFLVAGTAPPETGPPLLSYALSLAPLGVVVGAAGGRRLGMVRDAGRRSAGWAVGGALVAVLAATVTAQLLATIRLWQSGATGTPTLGSLRYAREMLFVFGLLPGVTLVGAAIGQWALGARRLLGAAFLGGAIALLAGPSLIVVALLGRVGVNPVILVILVLGVVAVVGRRAVPKA